jgi:predicted  nucleic acid-binding Zn-ribbon protein
MHPAIPHLIELQRVDLTIGALRAEIDSYPKRIQEADSKLSGARAAVAAAKEAHTNALKERKRFELDVDQWKDRARKYRDQSGAVKTNEAYKALLHEIANAEAEVAKAEDRQLDVMMSGEEFEQRVRHAEADLKEAETSVAADRKEIHSRYDEKQKLLKAALAERERIAAPVPKDLLELYERIAKRNNGTAMAQVRDDQCRGCGMRVLPHIIQELRQEANEEIYRCEMCGLILYTLDPIPVANSGSGSGSDKTSATSAINS